MPFFGFLRSKAGDKAPLLERCLSVDLEVDPKTATIFDLAAVRHGSSPPVVAVLARLAQSLDRLEAALEDADHIIGHNILRHDIEHLLAARPRLRAKMTAPIDTLWLNPLAFPRNPYHHLVKHYQDGRLQAGHVNDPELDARLVFEVLDNQIAALKAQPPDTLLAWHHLVTRTDRSEGFDAVFREVRRASAPDEATALSAIRRLLDAQACGAQVDTALDGLRDRQMAWPMAYALAWISVSGGESVMPPWVRASFPQAALIVRALRDTNCGKPSCQWCATMNDPKGALKKWFGFPAFRPEPTDATGRPLQEVIVEKSMAHGHVLGILPTGTGKSVCYQVPALSLYEKTGALTVVISPLVALMADQVQGMERAGISSAVTINGMLSMPERQEALDRVRLGQAAILLISPEQLRSVSVRSVLKQREVGLWVLDEAHCVSKWGHDFRPDYRYIGRFIREFSGDAPIAPVLCLTATAKPEVVRDITDHFRDRLGVELGLFDGGATRTNLTFSVLPTGRESKLGDILKAIEDHLPEGRSGAVVYCASRKATERIAEHLKSQGLAAAHFHAGLTAEEKRTVQEAFRIGDLRVIAATNAFGMGIDKPDIRLVVHADIPGSLENYLQEAGRAGRDRQPADCVLLYHTDDVERQFTLTARSHLKRHEIGAILKALRRIDEQGRNGGKVVATTGEIVREEKDREFVRDSATDDTRVKTAVSWLEEATLVAREENRVQVFPSSLRVRTLAEAETLLNKPHITSTRRKQLLDIVRHLMNVPADQGVSTDELTGIAGLTHRGLAKAMADLETLGVAKNDIAITVQVHIGIENASRQRFAAASALERGLIGTMRELSPEADAHGGGHLDLTLASQRLRETGNASAGPHILERLLRSIERDGRDEDGGQGNIRLRKLSAKTLEVTLQRSWRVVEQTAALRWTAAERLLEFLISKTPPGSRGKDIQVETTLGDLIATLNGDAVIRAAGIKDMTKLMERGLLWLHEQEVLTLGKGLTVFRSAMTIHLNPERGQFAAKDFLPLQEHYREQTVQTHVMAAYADKGLDNIAEAQRLAQDYFALDQDRFLRRWLPGKSVEIRRQTTGKAWKQIVDDLGNPAQQDIVADDREETNVLVLAGPGSGKTRVLVHRIAYLLRVRREDPRGILVLTYNRHAAAEIKARLRGLVGEDAAWVTVSTCHALAMRLVGASFAGAATETRDFDAVLQDAVRLINGEGLSRAEAEAQREALIQGYRWILVDEYQDIGPDEYALIAAVAGRSLEDPDQRLSLFAVGDDDQNIYAFSGASISFIRQFEQDYRAKPKFLTENYRSTRYIIDAANQVIEPAQGRMKAGHPITVDKVRSLHPGGGVMATYDPVGRGRVQFLDVAGDDVAQGVAAVDELVRLSHLDPNFAWSRTAIISRDWKRLAPVRAYAEKLGLPVEMANEKLPSVWRMREMQRLVTGLREQPSVMLTIQNILEVLNRHRPTRWTDLIAEGIADLARDLGTKTIPVPDAIEWLAEWARDVRGAQRGLLLLTAHRSKGLEFDHVVILNGGWQALSQGEDGEAPRRLFYVAMTRARRSLAVVTSGAHAFVRADSESELLRRVEPPRPADLPEPDQYQLPDMGVVDLSYAGRVADSSPSLAAIVATEVDAPVTLDHREGKWMILDTKGRVLGRMASNWDPPRGTQLVSGKVGAIVRWTKADNEEAFQTYIKRGEWETVLPELVFR
ncbi:RecQ family ATP-dependent DNA helicase [Paragemmobacter straminiformis]|uniref:DNA 3'-5' helicase n=1 Tax=Paragemmobacter straminiformis TaxID=2045119 RepID=A0A842I564_9RHOB|nr:RecQ family ATP-dependent DNA helicase [Gemmobacter straminiformis]MBC2834088.1 RecQ family ATP-dependent DNA helicase [Gemmobacter straminiformis]